MKSFLLPAIFFHLFSFGQTAPDYRDVPEIKVVSGLSAAKLAGKYEYLVGFGGIRVHLYPSGKFTREFFGCTDSEVMDSGTWISSGSRIGLAAAAADEHLDLVQIGRYLVLVPPESKQQFILYTKWGLSLTSKLISEADIAVYIVERMTNFAYCRKLAY